MNECFATAHLNSWPVTHWSMSRDFFERRKAEIMKSAKKHGFSILGSHAKDPEGKKQWAGEVVFVRTI